MVVGTKKYMKDLAYLNKFFIKYRWRLIPGVLFVIISNVFGVLPAPVIRIAFDLVTENIRVYQLFSGFNRQAIIYRYLAPVCYYSAYWF